MQSMVLKSNFEIRLIIFTKQIRWYDTSLFLLCQQNMFLLCQQNMFLLCQQNKLQYVDTTNILQYVDTKQIRWHDTSLFLLCQQNMFLLCQQNILSFVLSFQKSAKYSTQTKFWNKFNKFHRTNMLILHDIDTGWRRLIGSPKLQIIFHKRATKYRSLLRKMTYKDKGSYESSPLCITWYRYKMISFFFFLIISVVSADLIWVWGGCE